MARVGELLAEAARLRELVQRLPQTEARGEIQALIEELERRARELGNGDGNHEILGRHALLSELTTAQLLDRAQAYRAMAESASINETRNSLHEVAAKLELIVDKRRRAALPNSSG